MLAVALVALKFWPRTGTLTVTGVGPNGAPPDMLEIRVDDRTVCTQSPCSVARLAVGAHTVEVSAPGYVKSAARAAEIEAGQTAVLDFSLTPATTGLRVGALGPNLRLLVDGRDRGPLPASVDDVGAGSHSIRIEGNDRYRPFDQALTLGPGEIKTLAPKLAVARGLARVEPGENAKGARVWLVCSSGAKRELRLPAVNEVATDQACRVEASKVGCENASLALSFDDGQAEKSFTVDLARTSVAPPTAALHASRATERPAAARPPPPAAKPVMAAGPQGSINMNSMPVSSVTVDGNPAGQTPARVSVPPGNHTVVFTHPQKGRKSLTVKVRAGATSRAVVRFD
jgi:serine/threonine-protein kinase